MSKQGEGLLTAEERDEYGGTYGNYWDIDGLLKAQHAKDNQRIEELFKEIEREFFTYDGDGNLILQSAMNGERRVKWYQLHSPTIDQLDAIKLGIEALKSQLFTRPELRVTEASPYSGAPNSVLAEVYEDGKEAQLEADRALIPDIEGVRRMFDNGYQKCLEDNLGFAEEARKQERERIITQIIDDCDEIRDPGINELVYYGIKPEELQVLREEK